MGPVTLPHDLDLRQDRARGSFIGTVDSVALKKPPSAQMFLEGEKEKVFFPLVTNGKPPSSSLPSFGACLGEERVLHWSALVADFPVFLTVMYMLHLDFLMAKKVFFFKETNSTNHEAV